MPGTSKPLLGGRDSRPCTCYAGDGSELRLVRAQSSPWHLFIGQPRDEARFTAFHGEEAWDEAEIQALAEGGEGAAVCGDRCELAERERSVVVGVRGGVGREARGRSARVEGAFEEAARVHLDVDGFGDSGLESGSGPDLRHARG